MTFRLARFLAGSLAGFLAGHMLNFGLVQWAQEVLHAPAWSGAFFLLSFGLPVVFGWHGGVVSDRLHPLRVARRGHAVFLVATLLMALGSAVPWLRRDQLVFAWVTAFITGLGWSYASPARLAALPRLVPPERIRPAAILFNVLSTVGFGGAPLLVGLVRRSHSWPAVFLVACVLLLVSLVCFAGLPTTERTGEATQPSTFADGFRYIRATPVVAQLLVASAIAHLMMGPINVLLPRFLDQALGLDAAWRGSFLGMAAPALIVGGLVALRLTRLVHPGRTLAVGIIASGTLCALLSAAARVPVAAVLFFLACSAAGFAVALLAASLQENSDPARRGRVMATYSITTQFFPAFSGLGCGVLLSRVDAANALLVVTLTVVVLATVLLVTGTALRQFVRVQAANAE